MRTFFKTQISSLLATLVDFLTTILCVELLKIQILEASILGAMTGAFTNFLVNKYWSFETGTSGLKRQSLRYFLVWIGSVLLNTLGLYILTGVFHINYIFSKITVAIIVGIAFNYTLQKHYVFARHEKIFTK